MSGTVGFATAIGVHPLIGYNDLIHVGPAVAGGVVFWLGLGLTAKGKGNRRDAEGEEGAEAAPASVPALRD